MSALNVLICDDSILARRQLSDTIKGYKDDITIFEASNGQECIDLYKEHRPDLVFVDIVMPVVDGVGAVNGVLSSDPDAKVIIVSSVGTRTELKRALEAGARDFIQKPFSQDQIHEVLDFYTR